MACADGLPSLKDSNMKYRYEIYEIEIALLAFAQIINGLQLQRKLRILDPLQCPIPFSFDDF